VVRPRSATPATTRGCSSCSIGLLENEPSVTALFDETPAFSPIAVRAVRFRYRIAPLGSVTPGRARSSGFYAEPGSHPPSTVSFTRPSHRESAFYLALTKAARDALSCSFAHGGGMLVVQIFILRNVHSRLGMLSADVVELGGSRGLTLDGVAEPVATLSLHDGALSLSSGRRRLRQRRDRERCRRRHQP